jgi:transcriptional regulator with XRE-family HTH domain
MAKSRARAKVVDPRAYLTRWMEETRHSQAALARKAGISQRTMALVMRGRRITDRTAMALAPIVGVAWGDLWEAPPARRKGE